MLSKFKEARYRSGKLAVKEIPGATPTLIECKLTSTVLHYYYGNGEHAHVHTVRKRRNSFCFDLKKVEEGENIQES